jgi:predicted lipid carrier protein YhbT
MLEIKKLIPGLLNTVPMSIQAEALSIVVNRMLRGQPLRTRLGELHGRTVCVCISDIPWQMDFRIRDRHIRAVQEGVIPDVTISGELQDFMELLGGRADPDALFFQRRLNMEGDTEVGVHIKNLLDSLEYDWDTHFDATLIPALADRAKRYRHGIHELFTKYYRDKSKNVH